MKEQSRKRKIVITSLVAAILIVGAGGFLVFATKNKPADEPKETKPVSMTPTPTLTATPTTSEDIEPSPTIEDEQDKKPPTPTPTSTPTPSQNTNSSNSSASVINCGNSCTYAPVDKNNQLPSSYNPGGVLASAQTDFNSFVGGARNAGINVEVISSFRSFATQSSTFEYWVGVEMQSGKSRAAAEAAANVYSAKPGHSEHQLGTTFDVKCAGCTSFDANQNAKLYKFIENNAHKYGFVVSYPKNSANLTGYTYEPWHIRWIGKTLASELYNTGYINGNGNYLTKFLRSKGY